MGLIHKLVWLVYYSGISRETKRIKYVYIQSGSFEKMAHMIIETRSPYL
jgi:hypothetical protein